MLLGWYISYLFISQSSYSLSVFLLFCIYSILNNKAKIIQKYKTILISSSIIIPYLLLLIPFIKPYYGFGPNGFLIPLSDNKFKPAYFFCGWKSTFAFDNQTQKNYLNLSYGLVYSLPLLILVIIEIYMIIRINQFRKNNNCIHFRLKVYKT